MPDLRSPRCPRGFYPILDLGIAAARGHDPLRLVTGLAVIGVSCLQLRGKAVPAGPFLAFATAAVQAAGAATAVIVNDRVDIAWLSQAAGVHLGQTDLPPAAARPLLGPAAIIGLSTHSASQALAAIRAAAPGLSDPSASGAGVAQPDARPAWAPIAAESPDWEDCRDTPDLPRAAETGAARLHSPRPPFYLAIGPVFATATKRNPDPVVGVETISRLRAFYSGPLVAIGGISLERCQEAWSAGADAVAVIGGWMEDSQPLARAREYMLAFESFCRQSGKESGTSFRG